MEESMMRVSDAERAEALRLLGDLMARGYISITEFEERSDKAVLAQTKGQISELFMDIPAHVLHHGGVDPEPNQPKAAARPPAPAPAPLYPARLRQNIPRMAVAAGAVFVGLVILDEIDDLWPLLIIVALGFLLVRGGNRPGK